MHRWVALVLALGCVAMPASGKDAMDCSIGSVEKTFGGSQWLVHGCSDGRSVVLVSAPGNPAMPFYFFLFPEGDGYRLYGEGNGDRSATKPAYEALSAALSAEFVDALHAEASLSASTSGIEEGG
jgi:hypothetical protein